MYENEEDNIFCIECGFELPATAKFCKKCGVQIEASESSSKSDTKIKEDKPSVTEPVTEASSSKANKTSNVILEWVITFAVAIIVFFMGGILFGAKNGSWIGVIGFLISRALANLCRLFYYSQYFLKKETVLIFLKGKTVKQEIEQARTEWNFFYEPHKSISDESGNILVIKNLRKKND